MDFSQDCEPRDEVFQRESNLGEPGFLGGSAVKNLPATGSIPGSGRSLGEGNGNPLQYSCLGNPIEEPGGPRVVVYGVQKRWT